MHILWIVSCTVINVTLPDEKQNYVHRIGRVGRAERYMCIKRSYRDFLEFLFLFFNKLTIVVEKPLLFHYFRMGLAISLVAKEKEKVVIVKSKIEWMLFT